MAKKSKNKDLINLLAFLVVIINGTIWLLQAIGVKIGALEFISYGLLLIVVLFSGWLYARGLDQIWRIIYLIITIITILVIIR